MCIRDRLTTVVNIDQVQVSATAKVLKRVVGIVSPLGTQRVPLNPLNATIENHQEIKIPSETSKSFRMSIHMICRDLFAKSGFTLGVAMHGFVQTSLTTNLKPEARVAERNE